jgi:hypothetical protein
MAHGARWLKLSVDWDGSEWLCVLSAESQLSWVKFLCYVKGFGSCGSVSKRSPLTLSRIFGLGEEHVRKMLAAAEADGAIRTEGDAWRVTNWVTYQGNDAERMRNKRRKVTESEPDVRERSEVFTNVQDVRVEKEKEKENKRKTTSFQKPAPEEIDSYFLEIGSSRSESEKFQDFYSSNGWKVGRNPMRDWKATARNWHRRNTSQGKDSQLVSWEEARRLAR